VWVPPKIKPPPSCPCAPPAFCPLESSFKKQASPPWSLFGPPPPPPPPCAPLFLGPPLKIKKKKLQMGGGPLGGGGGEKISPPASRPPRAPPPPWPNKSLGGNGPETREVFVFFFSKMPKADNNQIPRALLGGWGEVAAPPPPTEKKKNRCGFPPQNPTPWRENMNRHGRVAPIPKAAQTPHPSAFPFFFFFLSPPFFVLFRRPWWGGIFPEGKPPLPSPPKKPKTSVFPLG